MRKILIRSGVYALVTMTVLYIITLIAGKFFGYSVQEIFGYGGIIVSLLFVYFGMRRYRDDINGGALSFGQGLKAGLFITLIPSFVIATMDLIYTTFINPHFYEDYYTNLLAKMKTKLPANEYEAFAREMASQKAIFANKPFQFMVMFFTVLLIGIIITVISALILKRNRLKTA